MPLSQSGEVRGRLLDLFPATTVRATDHAPKGITKAVAIEVAADQMEPNEIHQFVAENFGRLHQHVHLFRWAPDEPFDPATPFGEPAFFSVGQGDEEHHFYLLDLTYHLVLDSPLEHAELEFNWPVKIVTTPNHIRAHFTIMAKSPQAYVDEPRGVVKSQAHPSEDHLVEEFQIVVSALSAVDRMDLNKGIKALWDADVFDAPVVQYKKARSTSRDVMDQTYTVKSDAPELYHALHDKPLFDTTFVFTAEDSCIKYFVVDPTNGHLTFRRFSSTTDCVDHVIREIIEAN